MPLLAERMHALARPSAQSELDDLVDSPLQGHNLGSLHLDYFDLLASLALTVICRFFTIRVFVGLQRLLAHWPGFLIFFDLLILDKSSSVLLFSRWLFGWNFCLFLA